MAVRTCKHCGTVLGASRPTHTHTCIPQDEGEEPHAWECESPYCNAKERTCPDHGGEKPREI